VESNHTPISTKSPAIGFAVGIVSDLSGCQPLGSHTYHYTLSAAGVKYLEKKRKKFFSYPQKQHDKMAGAAA